MMKTLRVPEMLHSPLEAAVHPRGFEMRRVATREDWSDVRSLRFDALRERAEIDGNEEGGYGDCHDAALNSTTFLLLRNARPVASTRSSVSSAKRRWALPASEPGS